MREVTEASHVQVAPAPLPGDGAFQEVTEVTGGQQVIRQDWCSYEKRHWIHVTTEDRHMRTQGRGGRLQGRERGLRRTNPAHTLILDVQPPGLWEDKFHLV